MIAEPADRAKDERGRLDGNAEAKQDVYGVDSIPLFHILSESGTNRGARSAEGRAGGTVSGPATSEVTCHARDHMNA